MTVKLLTGEHLEFLSFKEATAQACLSLCQNNTLLEISWLISWFVCLQAGCSDVEGTLCSRDSDCRCFGLYLCIQNTCKSAVSDVGMCPS